MLYPLYEWRLVRALDFSQTPHHVGVILDGNRRWAKANQLDPHDVGVSNSARGHRAGAEKIIEFITNDTIKNKDIELQSGKLILVPSVNYCALKVGIRMIPTIGDLNRKYPTNLNNLITNCPTTNKIINLVKNADFVLDFHEGWGFNRLNKNSMGSSITPSITPKSHDIAKLLLDAVNKTIKDNNKNFIILTKDYKKYNETVNYDYSESIDIKGSLRYFENILNKDSLFF